MCYYDHGLVGHAAEVFKELLFRSLIQCACSFVQKQYGTVGIYRPCNGYPLHLSLGETRSALTQKCISTVFKCGYEFLGTGYFQRSFHAFGTVL